MLDPAPGIISASWEGKVTGVDEDIALSKSTDWNMHSSVHVPLDTIHPHPWTQRRILQLNSNLTFKEMK